MALHNQIWLTVSVTWIGLRLLDILVPPHNPVLNALIAVTAALALLARHLPDSR